MRADRRWALCLIASGIVVAGSSSGLSNPPFVRITPAEVHWQDLPGGHGVKIATLAGDPDKPGGMYVIRVKFPPHLMDSPHWHPQDRYVTVLEGTWYTGTGDTFDPAHAIALKPGSFMFHPAKASHWDGSAGDEPVIVQIMGEGPGTSTQVDPKQPAWVEVHR